MDGCEPRLGGTEPLTPGVTILGVEFFAGTSATAMVRLRDGGLLVAPAAPALKDLSLLPAYREAILNADVVLPDSGFMVLIWNCLRRNRIRRLSGLEFIRHFVSDAEVLPAGRSFWIMPGIESTKRNLAWLETQGMTVPADCVYQAPFYGPTIEDPALLEQIARARPDHVVVCLGGGTQERLGLYLKRHLSVRPAIYCIGAAIGFLSGDQVNIPPWGDRLYLGWLFRCASNPRQYLPRYWSALRLLPLMMRYGSNLPPLRV